VQHHAEQPSGNIFKRIIQRHVYPKADRYLFATVELADKFIKEGIVERKKVEEIMECSTNLQPLFYKPDGDEYDRSELFLWVGRLDENKDPLTVLRAIKMLKANKQKFMLYMVYNAISLETQVKSYIQDNGLQPHVRLLGSMDQASLNAYYNKCGYYLSASHYEGSGLALCEAMACGCVPVVTKIPSFIKMTGNGACGLLYRVGNVDELCDKLLSTNEKQRELLSEKAKEQFRNHLSFQAIARDTEKILESLLKK
jgi:glycosyltransferase involved in cell wall biosynthesis